MSKRRSYQITARRTKAGKVSLRASFGWKGTLGTPFTWATLSRAEAIVLWISLDRALDGKPGGKGE